MSTVIFPGQSGYLLGQPAMPSGPTALQNESSASIGAGAYGNVVVISPCPGGNPSTQRQVTWQIETSVSVNFDFEGSIDGSVYTKIDNYTGSSDSVRIIQADTTATPGPQALSAAKIVSACRYFRIKNAAIGAVSAIVKMNSL